MRFWVDGGLVAAEEARVSVLDHGFTVGDGVFETLKSVPGPDGAPRPFAMDRHITRLAESARGLGLPEPGREGVAAALLAVCAANPELAGGARIRVTYTSGEGPLGSDRFAGRPTLAVAVAPSAPWPATTVLALSPWPRNERSPLAGLKSTSYAENVRVLAHARSLGAGEALLANLAGHLCEGSGSNVFVVRGDRVITPPRSSGCLAGITRGLVLEWCADAGIGVEEALEVLDSLADSDELFVTSSTRDVHPVSEVRDVQGRTIWRGEAGPVTQRIARVFAERAAQDWNP